MRHRNQRNSSLYYSRLETIRIQRHLLTIGHSVALAVNVKDSASQIRLVLYFDKCATYDYEVKNKLTSEQFTASTTDNEVLVLDRFFDRRALQTSSPALHPTEPNHSSSCRATNIPSQASPSNTDDSYLQMSNPRL